MRIDTRAPVFDEVVISPASGILGIGDDIDYTLRIINLDSSAGSVTNNGLTITVNNYTSSNDVSFISVVSSNQFNDNNVVIPNGVYGTLEISGVTFLDRAGNNITNFSSITTNITIDTIAPSYLLLSNTNIGEFLPSGTSVGNVTIVDIGDQSFTYSLNGVEWSGVEWIVIVFQFQIREKLQPLVCYLKENMNYQLMDLIVQIILFKRISLLL